MGLASLSLSLSLLLLLAHTQIARETGGNQRTLQLHYITVCELIRIRVTAALRYSNCFSKKREGVPEMGTKPLKALRGYRASNRGSKKPQSRL